MTEQSGIKPGSVSIVICAWNNWPDLDMTIASALHQSRQPLEVIVVDNTSIDPTSVEVSRRFGSRVRYICQPNAGCAGAYNTGFTMAVGEFIQFLAGDDVFAPNEIEKQLEIFRAKPELTLSMAISACFRLCRELQNGRISRPSTRMTC